MAKKPSPSNTILDDAKDLVYGPRAAIYGHPADNFKVTANMWTAFLKQRCLREGMNVEDFEFMPEDVALFMAMVKIARLANTPGHVDSLVDLAGYAATAARCLEVAE